MAFEVSSTFKINFNILDARLDLNKFCGIATETFGHLYSLEINGTA